MTNLDLVGSFSQWRYPRIFVPLLDCHMTNLDLVGSLKWNIHGFYCSAITRFYCTTSTSGVRLADAVPYGHGLGIDCRSDGGDCSLYVLYACRRAATEAAQQAAINPASRFGGRGSLMCAEGLRRGDSALCSLVLGSICVCIDAESYARS
jgi:hypothetical protein